MNANDGKETLSTPSELAYGKDLVLRLLLYIHSRHVQSCLQLGIFRGLSQTPQETLYSNALIEEARNWIQAGKVK